MKKLIYLASPYSSEYADTIERRVQQVQDATARLIEKGHLIFSPIVHSHYIADQVSFAPTHDEGTDFSKPGSTWMDYDKAMIDKSDELWVLCLPDWEKSRGVDAEIAHAFDTGKTVRFIDYPALNGSQIDATAPYIRARRISAPTVKASPADVKADEQWRGLAKRKARSNTWDTLSSGKPPLLVNHDHAARIPKAEAERLLKTIFGEDTPLTKPTTSLPEDAADRNSMPMAEGLLYYFPNALAEVSKISKFGNDQHNPGQEMHWSRGKSTDHANKIIRHLIDAGKTDAHGNRHSAFVCWRALALLQEELEQANNLPLPKNARYDNE